MLLTGTKDDSKLLRWVEAAAGKDETFPALLAGLHSQDDYIVACDGQRLHAAKSDLLPDGTWSGKVRAGNFETEMQETGAKYPDFHAIMPIGEPAFEIWVTPRLVVDALKGMDMPVCLRFYTAHGAFEAFDPEQGRYALIMPVANPRDRDLWRPENAKTAMRKRLVAKLAAAEKALAEMTAALNTDDYCEQDLAAYMETLAEVEAESKAYCQQ